MTQRVNGLVIALEKDIREDDVEFIVNAIKMIKGVIDVTPHVVDHVDWLNRTKLRIETETKIIKAVREAFDQTEE